MRRPYEAPGSADERKRNVGELKLTLNLKTAVEG
jgi:hypothetical protein